MRTSSYLEERDLLKSLFPRGRFVKDEDDTCILRALNQVYAGDHVFVQSPGKLLGIFYVGAGGGARYRNPLGDLVVGEVKCDGEGILHVRWSQEAADKLPWFTLRDATNPDGAAENFSRPAPDGSAQENVKQEGV